MITGSYSGSIITMDFNDINSDIARWIVRNTSQFDIMEQTDNNVRYYSSSISFEYNPYENMSIYDFVEFVVYELNNKF